MSEKHIIMLTMYEALPCIKTAAEKKVVVIKVKNQKEKRLSISYGNVNLTDFWLEMLDEFIEQELSYTAQHISLLGDNKSDWWDRASIHQPWVGLGFLKIKRDENISAERSVSQIKERLEQENPNAAIYYTFGNADLVIAVSEKKEENLVDQINNISSMTISDGYDSCYLSCYFMVGQIQQSEKENHWEFSSVKIEERIECPKHEMYLEGWCGKEINSLREQMSKYQKAKNKKMISYYQAVLQIMNVIAQYERSVSYKDMFYMFFPSVRLFLCQLAEGVKKIDTPSYVSMDGQCEMTMRKNECMQNIEKSISTFLDDMEVLLHHIGYSCRAVLSDQRRGGIPYDIPFRLCKMYMVYLYELTHVLNDKSQYEYQYCLAPLAYSRPTTGYLDFGLSPAKRLIEVRISRSMLYMPRSLMVILAHEVSHYAGTNIRNRKMRASCYMEIVINALSHFVIPEDILNDCVLSISDKSKVALQEYIDRMQVRIYNRLYQAIPSAYNDLVSAKYKEEKMDEKMNEERYHFYVFREDLDQCVQKVMEDNEHSLENAICMVDEEIMGIMRTSENPGDLLVSIKNIQDMIMHRKSYIWQNCELTNSLELIAKVLREAYADISAVLVLDLSLDNLLEAFVISEGVVPDDSAITPFLINRIALVQLVMEKKKDIRKKKIENIRKRFMGKRDESDDKSASKNFRQKVKEKVETYLRLLEGNTIDKDENTAEPTDGQKDLFYCKDIFDIEKRYLSQCYDDLKKHFADGFCGETTVDRQECIKKIRNLFRHFDAYPEGQEFSFAQLFEDYEILQQEYESEVRKTVDCANCVEVSDDANMNLK